MPPVQEPLNQPQYHQQRERNADQRDYRGRHGLVSEPARLLRPGDPSGGVQPYGHDRSSGAPAGAGTSPVRVEPPALSHRALTHTRAPRAATARPGVPWPPAARLPGRLRLRVAPGSPTERSTVPWPGPPSARRSGIRRAAPPGSRLRPGRWPGAVDCRPFRRFWRAASSHSDGGGLLPSCHHLACAPAGPGTGASGPLPLPLSSASGNLAAVQAMAAVGTLARAIARAA